MKFSLLILSIMITPQCYKVLTFKELERYLKSDAIKISEYDTCLKSNNSCAYYLKSGEVVLLPNNPLEESKGLLIASKQCFFDFIDSDFFPIENEKKTIEEKYKSDIEHVNTNIHSIIESLVSKLTPANNKATMDTAALSSLLQSLKTQRNKLLEKELFYAALALGEYLRKVNNGSWIILKKYGTFNPYYTPAIIYPDNSVLLFWDYLNSYFKNSTITPEVFAGLPYIKNPGLKLESPFFKNNFFGYKKLN